MAEQVKGWCRLPMGEKRLSEEIDRYFDKCMQEGAPPTPSGLALWLGVRTSELSDERLSNPQRAVIGRAMQRIEASTMEMMLTRGGVKGMESILERVEENGERARESVRRLTDEELDARLRLVVKRIDREIGAEE